MNYHQIIAVMVTYQPDEDVVRNIAVICSQARRLIVVDNGSSADAFALIFKVKEEYGFTLIANNKNEGIAAALNKGVREAISFGATGVLLLDQDSTPERGCLTHLHHEYQSRTNEMPIGIAIPTYRDRRSGEIMPVSRAGKDRILTARTSGSLIPIHVFQECGFFREELFIDGVDSEYCLRMQRHGYRIIQSDMATMTHSLGARRTHTSGKSYSFVSTHHNAARRYYITRNRIFVVRLYWRWFPAYCYELFIFTLKDTVKILLVERDKLAKAASSLRGLIDGMFTKLGEPGLNGVRR